MVDTKDFPVDREIASEIALSRWKIVAHVCDLAEQVEIVADTRAQRSLGVAAEFQRFEDKRLSLLEIALVELILSQRFEIVGDIDGIIPRTVDAKRLSKGLVRCFILFPIGQA